MLARILDKIFNRKPLNSLEFWQSEKLETWKSQEIDTLKCQEIGFGGSEQSRLQDLSNFTRLLPLHDYFDMSSHPDVHLVDATWSVPGDETALPRSPILGSVFFDLQEIKSLPLNNQTPDAIAKALGRIGIRPYHHIVIYDRKGFFSSSRLWWLLMQVGHKHVDILNVELSTYSEHFPETENFQYKTLKPTHYPQSAPLLHEAKMDDVRAAIDTETQIVDARPRGRFDGSIPEPRLGLRSGHIPSSKSLPFSRLVANGALIRYQDLAAAVHLAEIDLEKPIITTCGSGVTAAGLAFVFTRLGAKNVRVYTGSWAEWGASDAPIEI